MDKLRSPGGCPWDAEQTHASLARYLLEEAYEAFEAIEDGDLDGLREELGDVLLQVVFHARLAAERSAPDGWDIDDVAAGLVDKLVRRHPHVFAEVEVSGAADVETNWAAIKKAEKARESAVAGVPLSQPALTLAAKLQRRAESAGVPSDLLAPPRNPAPAAGPPPAGRSLADTAAAIAAEQVACDAEGIGDLLFDAVALARASGVDAEAALRARSRRFRDQMAATEAAARAAGRDPELLAPEQWRLLWRSPQAGDAEGS